MLKEVYFHGTAEENVPEILETGLKTREGRGTLAKDLSRCLKHLQTNLPINQTAEETLGNGNGTVLIVAPQERKIKRRIGATMEETTDDQGQITIQGFPSQWLRRREYAVFSGSLPTTELEKMYQDKSDPREKRWGKMPETDLPPEAIIGSLQASPELAALLSKIKDNLDDLTVTEDAWAQGIAKYLTEALAKGEIKIFQEDQLTLADLAEKIVSGAVESYIVGLVRELYLGIRQKYQNVKVADLKNNRDYSHLAEEVEEKLTKLQSLHFENPKLERYRATSLKSLEELITPKEL